MVREYISGMIDSGWHTIVSVRVRHTIRPQFHSPAYWSPYGNAMIQSWNICDYWYSIHRDDNE